MAAGLMAVARPLVSFLYGGGEFGQRAVDVTASALSWISLGMAGYALQNILSRAYFARQQGRGPLVAGTLSIGVNLLLCMALVGPLEVRGLAIASAVSSTVYALLLIVPMEREGQGFLDRALCLDFFKMLAAAAVTGLTAWLLLGWLGSVLPAGKMGELLSLALCAGGGVAVYFGVTLSMGMEMCIRDRYQKGLQLYSSGVLIMDKCADLLPDHFRFVRGVVDSADFSLNISREVLQHTRQLKVIATALEKKIKSELLKMQKEDREKYEKFWAAFGAQLKYGVVAEYGAHKEMLQDLLLLSLIHICASGGLQQPAQQLDQRGFPAPVGAEQPNDPATAYLQIHSGQGDLWTVGFRKPTADD